MRTRRRCLPRRHLRLRGLASYQSNPSRCVHCHPATPSLAQLPTLLMAASRSRSERSKTLVAVCCCLRGASRSATNHSSITGLDGSSFDARLGYSAHRVAQVEFNAAPTVPLPHMMSAPNLPCRHPIPCVCASVRVSAKSSSRDRSAVATVTRDLAVSLTAH